jgi:hypothetical protein
MTLDARAKAYAVMFPHNAASHLRVVKESGADVLYGTWLLGNDYRNKTQYYGAYPPSYLNRVAALFPDVTLGALILHAFSGSLPGGEYTRLDINPQVRPDVVGSVYDVATLFPHQRFRLVYADPPYTEADAVKYGTAMVDRRRAIAALADVTQVGGHLVWLDCVWPIHRKVQWRTVARISLIRSTNHRVREVSIFERQAA